MDCIFCRIADKEEHAYVVYEDEETIAFLDKFPQTRGHLQLIPKTHYRWIYEVPDMGKIFATAQRIIHAIIPVLKADHVTLSTLGHQIEHAHVWIVPQYRGKSESLNEWYRVRGDEREQKRLATQLRDALKKI